LLRIPTYQSIHIGRSVKVDTTVVSPHHMVDRRAIVRILRPIIHQIIRSYQANIRDPIPHLLRPIRIGLIPRIPGQSGPNIEQAAIGDGIPIVIALIPLEDLPFETPATLFRVPPRHQLVEDGLHHLHPARVAGGRVGEIPLGGHHGAQRPEPLVVVPFVEGLVARHEVPHGRGLEGQRLRGEVVVGAVPRQVPVIDQRAEHGPGFPPVVRLRQIAGDSAGSVASVPGEHVISDGAGGLFDGCCGAGC
jgi:hypothetical protein